MPREEILAPIPGKVVYIAITENSYVKEDDLICSIDSMKMENPILTPVSGRVIKVAVSLGQIVKTGQLLAIIEY